MAAAGGRTKKGGGSGLEKLEKVQVVGKEMRRLKYLWAWMESWKCGNRSRKIGKKVGVKKRDWGPASAKLELRLLHPKYASLQLFQKPCPGRNAT